MRKSAKTTIGGVTGAVGVLINVLRKLVDDDPETVFSFGDVGMILVAIGIIVTGVFARDDDASDSGTPGAKDVRK